jgi:hypothetical protein
MGSALKTDRVTEESEQKNLGRPIGGQLIGGALVLFQTSFEAKKSYDTMEIYQK